jgi:adenylate cyclase
MALRLFRFAIGCYFSRAYEDPVAAANTVIRAFPEWPPSYRFRAAALGRHGRTDEAKGALEKAITVATAAFDMYVRGRPPWYWSVDHAHLLEGLRKAGWEG